MLTNLSLFSQLTLLGIIMLLLDAVFLYSTSSFVMPVYQSIQQSPITIRYSSMALCYLVMIAGLYYFIIREHRSSLDAFFLGVFVYGVYDLTVLTIFKKYTPMIAIMDILWGGILFSSTTILFRILMKSHKQII